jgi:hypothetical protein
MLYFFVIFNIKNFYKYKTEIEFLLIVKLKLSKTITLMKYKVFLKNKPLVKTLTYMIKTMTINTNKCFIHLHIKPHLLSLITQNNSKVIRK